MMLDGVTKSGSPMENETMSMPCAFRSLTRLEMAMVPDAGISWILFET